MTIKGADTVAVNELEQRIGTYVERLEGVVNADHAFVSGISQCWNGADSESFTRGWRGQDRPAIDAVVASLVVLQTELRSNRLAQEETSNTLGGTRAPAPSPDRTGDGEDGGALDRLLGGLGLAPAIQDVLEGMFLDAFDEIPTGIFSFLTSDVPKILGKAALVAEFFVDVAEQHAAGLPLDEVIVHATLETVARFAVDEGVDRVVHAATAAAIVAVSGGSLAFAANTIGALSGHLVGEVIEWGVDAVDGYETIADGGLEAYRAAKAGVEFIGDVMEPVVDLVEDGIDFVAEGITDVVDGAGDVVDGFVDVVDGLWPF